MKRETFIKSILLGGSGAALGDPTKNQKIHLPLNQVKITQVQGYRFKKAHFIKIETDAGINGWGESDGSSKLFSSHYLKTGLKDLIVGKDPFDSEGIWHQCYLEGIEAGIGGIHPGTLSGVDNALWDLKGKLLDMPAHKILGGNGKDKVRVYGSYGRNQNGRYESPTEMARRAGAFVEEGYGAVKARMQIRQQNVNPYPDDIFACVKAIRQAIGDDIVLYIDFNNGYTPAEATVMGKRLYEHFNIAALEEPVFQQDYAGLAQVAQALDIPVMAGEHEYNKWMMKDLLTIGQVDILNADVIKCGGITECRKTAAMAHAFGKQIMVHNAKPTLATAASIQLLASIPNAATFQEYAGKRIDQGYGSLFSLFEDYFEFKDGHLVIPERPGLGLTVDEKAMEAQRLD